MNDDQSEKGIMTGRSLLKKINHDPILMSLLYDLDLMPEQIKPGTKAWADMASIVAHWLAAEDRFKRQEKHNATIA